MPLLTLLVALPLAGGIVILATGKGRDQLARQLALGVSLVTFVVSLVMWAQFNPASADYQLVERHSWLPEFGISYHLGVDGISLFLVVLTTFLTPIALLCSWESIESRVREFSFFMLALEAAMIGVFLSLDLFLFYLFWDAMLIPMYFLIGIWGYERRIYAAVKFILYTMAGSVLMLIAILWIAYYHQSVTGVPSFDLADLIAMNIPAALQTWLFLAFALAFAIKVPLFPFHTWLPDAHVEAPTAGSVILAGVLLKMGTYGLLRFAFPLFPEAAREFAPYLAILAVIGIVYGALVAMVQPDMKKLVAYSSVSHLGFVVLGICALNLYGVQGAVYQMLAHGISTGGLFLIVGMLSDRRHTRQIAEYGGLKAVMPKLVAAFLLITLASVALPGHERFHRRVPDPPGRVWRPVRPDLREVLHGRGRDWRHPVGGVHALDVPARELRPAQQSEEPRVARFERPRVVRDRADLCDGDLHGRRPRRVPRADGAGRTQDAAAGDRCAGDEYGGQGPGPDRAQDQGHRRRPKGPRLEALMTAERPLALRTSPWALGPGPWAC